MVWKRFGAWVLCVGLAACGGGDLQQPPGVSAPLDPALASERDSLPSKALFDPMGDLDLSTSDVDDEIFHGVLDAPSVLDERLPESRVEAVPAAPAPGLR